MHICMRDIRNDGVAHDWGGVIHSAVLYYADMLCYSPQAQRSMPQNTVLVFVSWPPRRWRSTLPCVQMMVCICYVSYHDLY